MKYDDETKLELMSNVFLKPPSLASTFNPIVFIQDIGPKQDAYRFLTPFNEFDTDQGKLKIKKTDFTIGYYNETDGYLYLNVSGT